MYKIVLHKRVIKFISSRNPEDKKRIKEKFELLQLNPYPSNNHLDLKKMKESIGFRLRVGNYRFIFDVEDEDLIIYMEKGDNRGDIY